MNSSNCIDVQEDDFLDLIPNDIANTTLDSTLTGEINKLGNNNKRKIGDIEMSVIKSFVNNVESNDEEFNIKTVFNEKTKINKKEQVVFPVGTRVSRFDGKLIGTIHKANENPEGIVIVRMDGRSTPLRITQSCLKLESEEIKMRNLKKQKTIDSNSPCKEVENINTKRLKSLKQNKSKKKKRKKRELDPVKNFIKKNRPKLIISAYTVFFQDKVNVIKKQYPNINRNTLFKKIGDLWQNLETKDRVIYDEKYKTLKIKNKKDILDFEEGPLKKFFEDNNETIIEYKNKSEKLKIFIKNNKPKKAKSSYNLFVKEKSKILRIKYPELDNEDYLKKIAEMWKNIDVKDRALYDKQSEELRLKYKKDLIHFKEGPLKKFIENNKNNIIINKNKGQSESNDSDVIEEESNNKVIFCIKCKDLKAGYNYSGMKVAYCSFCKKDDMVILL